MNIIDVLLITTIISNFTFAKSITSDDGVLQNLHLTLLTIEEKLTNLESFVMIQCGTRINGKLDYYGRKIDNIEKTLSKIEVQTKVDLEKVTESVNSRNFKEDISKERIIRNIDSVYEKINHKLMGMQGQADVTNLKIKNIGETIMAKLEKIEDTSTVRDGDMEAELNDVVTVMYDLKSTCTNMEERSASLSKKSAEKILNGSAEMKTYYKQLENNAKNISETMTYMQETFDVLVNQTANNSETLAEIKTEVLENLNEYANKFTDVHLNLWQKTDSLDLKIQQIMNVTQLSRNELQNNLRALMIQFGRLSGKQNVQNDYSSKLDELNKKVDANFQDVLLTQNLFLESCHRVQMDETQIESQISVVLNKLIDLFENKTTINANDIKHLEHMIRVHDSNIKRNVLNVLTNLKDLLQKIIKENAQIITDFGDQKQNLELVHVLLKDILNSKNPTLLETISRTIQNLQKIIEEPQAKTHNNTIQLLNDIQHEVVQQNTNNFNISTVIQNINFALSNIENKINNYFLNKNNAEEIANALSQHLQKYFKPRVDVDFPKLVKSIFAKPSVSEEDAFIFEEPLQYFNASKNEIENALLECGAKDIHCKKMYNSTYGIFRKSDQEYIILNCLPSYIHTINVRFTIDDEILNCTLITRSDKACLPNYVDLTNTQFNTDQIKKCIENEVLPNYLNNINVRLASELQDPNISQLEVATEFVNLVGTAETQNEAFRINLMTDTIHKNIENVQQNTATQSKYHEQEYTTTNKAINV